MLLRLLGALIVVLIVALTLIFKDVGKSQVAADPVTAQAAQ